MNIKEVIDVVKEFTGAQWAAIFAIVGMGIYGFTWVENRYAHKDTTEMIMDHVIRIDSKISALVDTQFTEEQANKINQSAANYEKQLRLYVETQRSKNP